VANRFFTLEIYVTGCEAGHSLSTISVVGYVWNFTSTQPYIIVALYLSVISDIAILSFSSSVLLFVCHLSNTVTVEPIDSTLLIPKLPIGHNTEPLSSTCAPSNLS
jgi:hypothetical protein